MKVFWTIMTVIVVLVVLLIGKCSMSLYDGIKNFPDYAKQEVVYKQYAQLIADLDIAIKSSTSQFSLAANIEKITSTSDIIYVGLEKNEGEPLVVKEKVKGSRRTTTMNGSGYGSVGEQAILIIDYPVNRHGIDDCVIYIKHERPDNEVATPVE